MYMLIDVIFKSGRYIPQCMKITNIVAVGYGLFYILIEIYQLMFKYVICFTLVVKYF